MHHLIAFDKIDGIAVPVQQAVEIGYRSQRNLGVILGLFGIKAGEGAAATGDLPFRLRDDYLSAAEYSSDRVLALPVALALPDAGAAAPLCPKCGIPMVERVSKRGPNAGQTFYGCSNYPRCKEMA